MIYVSNKIKPELSINYYNPIQNSLGGLFELVFRFTHGFTLTQHASYLDPYNYNGTESYPFYLSKKEITAYHEAGHTVMALLFPQYFEMYKVTIKPSAEGLGYSEFYYKKYDWELATLFFLGGTAAERFLSDHGKMPYHLVAIGSKGDFNKVDRLLEQNYKIDEFHIYYKYTKDLIDKYFDLL
ncbi:hypothetical protein HGD80_02145 [Paulownia witches'-broom phytoplasma]|uniref:Peptidase M41 domain-containing protein n=1 Tax=Paulownia witches'-broom phytoplasma TaxID=39647 RepID=A0ABX8TQP7_9MOLU|nr:hypothetical protein [Paulownia witches'-broom phytoplasma]QYC31350.1 hypothetical protein HGD80_02145 [Paulownia witches'-broom phytoplasma]